MKKKLKYSFTGTNICEGDRILVKRRKKVNTENSNNKQQTQIQEAELQGRNIKLEPGLNLIC